MISIKTTKEISVMLEGGKIARKAINSAVEGAKEGITTLELNNLAEKIIIDLGGAPCFKGFEGFPCATCINVNSGIVHGVPNKYKIKNGDVISVDLGVKYKDFNTDVSETFEVGSKHEVVFLETGRRALKSSIEKCVPGNRIGDISASIQGIIEEAGYSVSRDLAGHGVGAQLHEEPFIPGFGRAGRGLKLVEGMVLAIEVLYQKGKPALVLEKDGWTLSTKDDSLSGLYEKTVALTRQGPLVLT